MFSYVVHEHQKFRADVFKICGFALMTPLARYFLILSDIRLNDLTLLFWIHAVISFLLFCWGVIMIQWGYEEVRE